MKTQRLLRTILFLTFYCTFLLHAEEKKKTICVNMIVKNESQVITRCLGSVKPLIDSWVIVDTGSTDNTQNIIKEFMKDVPGELHERPWINFGHNRNEALQLAKGKADYILFIDADEVLQFSPEFVMPPLDKDSYFLLTMFGGTNYYRLQLIKDGLDWKWEGVLHETVGSPLAKTNGVIPGLVNMPRTDGARSQDPQKFLKDAAVLEKALEDDPKNTRYAFYLGQSYRDAGEYAKAIESYEKRIAMGGWDQEIYWSKLQIAHAQKNLDLPEETFLRSYYNTYHYRPTRVEPLYYLAHYYRGKGNYAAGYLISQIGLKLPVSNDILFVERYITDWALPLEYTICAFWCGDYAECVRGSKEILAKPNLTDSVRQCVERNMAQALDKMATIENARSATMQKTEAPIEPAAVSETVENEGSR